jgi:hypothetical protein
MRDLFQGDDGGWLQDVGLVQLTVTEKLNEESARIATEGWKWIEVALDFPYGHTFGLRQIRGEPVFLAPISDRLMTELTAYRTLGLRQALVAQSIAHAQALAKKFTGGKPEASVDAFLARRREESGE